MQLHNWKVTSLKFHDSMNQLHSPHQSTYPLAHYPCFSALRFREIGTFPSLQSHPLPPQALAPRRLAFPLEPVGQTRDSTKSSMTYPSSNRLLTSSMNCRPSLAASISADLTKSTKPPRHPLPTTETKCSTISTGLPDPSEGETHRLPRTYATSFLMSNGAVDSKRISTETASLECISFLCSTEPAATFDSTQADS